ncbi:MAG: 50S ribosomal protein L18 [Candidatus Woesebacteria bacterium GW2011_GWB1_45_5]|uniref:Large ribosomal subunit protein uL18 n=1 Tax=Candidatus Woesebacteria bacterium GW2011_GWB1_45_5 TaxID=1618581 RepID=A0A0G1MLU8_9BACT|nr:MAG: 50S ribosomal protein L18 [Candidatus Woesebacteria bacterium GW2011_GWB1_45_5]
MRVKSKVFGTGERPRLSVFRSNKYIYGQIIDDTKGKTLAAARGPKTAGEKTGEELAKKAITKKIKKVTFDRSGFRYHGKVKSLAEGARKGGLEF